MLGKLGLKPAELLRKGEAIYRELEIGRRDYSDAELIALMVSHPDLIQRPIIVRGKRAVLGRPPENVEQLL